MSMLSPSKKRDHAKLGLIYNAHYTL